MKQFENVFSLDVLRYFIDNLHEAVYFVDTNRKILYWNKRAEEISGYLAKDVVGSYCYNNILKHIDTNGINICENGCPLHDAIKSKKPKKLYVYLQHKDGYRVGVKITAIPIEKDGEIIGVFEVFTKESHISENEKIKQLTRLSFIDTLTQIPNRRYLEHILNKQIYDLHRYKKYFSLLFVDVDDFKSINDKFGHDVGDKALKIVAQTLKNTSRVGDFIGRYGGDEFLVISNDITNHAELAAYQKRLKAMLSSSFKNVTDFINYKVTLSIGGTISLPHETTESILKRADSLMYRAKKSGKDATIIG